MENIFERIIKTKYKRELMDLKKQFKEVLLKKEKMTEEHFKKQYPNCDYSIKDLKLIIKTINMRLKEFKINEKEKKTYGRNGNFYKNKQF